MLRWLVRKGIFCLLLISLFYYLHEKNPQWLQNLGRWIGGEVGNKVSVAISDIFEGSEVNKHISDFIEVFREGT